MAYKRMFPGRETRLPFPASIQLILGIGTGAVQGRYQKTRLGAVFLIGR